MVDKAPEPELTMELADKICDIVRDGVYPHVASESLGIPKKTLEKWKDKGEGAAKRGECYPDEDGVYRGAALDWYLLSELKKAKACAEIKKFKLIEEIGKGGQVIRRKTTKFKDGRTETVEEFSKGNFTAFGWQLERTMPEKYARQERQKIEGTLDVRHSLVDLTQAYDEKQSQLKAVPKVKELPPGTGDIDAGDTDEE